MAPPRVVDAGWHALILDTVVHESLCAQFGGLIHRYPERPDPDRYNRAVLTRTLELIEDAGYAPDLELWSHPNDGGVAVSANCRHSPNCRVTYMNPQDTGGCDGGSGGADVDQLICDHALFHLEADLRRLELTANHLVEVAAKAGR